MSRFNIDLSRESLSAPRAPKAAKVREVDKKPQQRAGRKDEDIIVLNDFAAYGQIGEMEVFVDPRECGNFTIKAGEITFGVKNPLKKLDEVVAKGKKYKLGKPKKEFKEFLKGNKWIDLEFPVIYDPTVLELSCLKRRPIVDNILLKDKSRSLVIIGKAFGHENLKDDSQIITGNLLKAEKVKIGGAEVIKIITVEGCAYILAEHSSNEPTTRSEEEDIDYFFDDSEDIDTEEDDDFEVIDLDI